MRGDFKVMMACCAWGNCQRCHASGNKALRKWRAISDRLDEETASNVAAAWRNFDAYVLPMDDNDKAKVAKAEAWFEANRGRRNG